MSFNIADWLIATRPHAVADATTQAYKKYFLRFRRGKYILFPKLTRRAFLCEVTAARKCPREHEPCHPIPVAERDAPDRVALCGSYCRQREKIYSSSRPSLITILPSPPAPPPQLRNSWVGVKKCAGADSVLVQTSTSVLQERARSKPFLRIAAVSTLRAITDSNGPAESACLKGEALSTRSFRRAHCCWSC